MTFSPIHTLWITDGKLLSTEENGVVIDLISASGSASQVGYGLDRGSLDLSPGNEQVLSDPATFSHDGQLPRASRFDNRPIPFSVTIKGTDHNDAQARLGALEDIARAARRYSNYSKGRRPYLKWRSALGTRSFYFPIYQMTVSTKRGYGGIDLTSNIIENVQVTLVTSPDGEEYPRPVFYAVAPTLTDQIGNRSDGAATSGYFLVPGDYLQNAWLRPLTNFGYGVVMWFKYEWNNASDAGRVRTFMDLNGVLYAQKDASGNFVVTGIDQASTGHTLTLAAATVNPLLVAGSWFGIYMQMNYYGGGFRAYFMTDGSVLGNAATVTPFSGAALGTNFYPPLVPAALTIGALTASGSQPLSVNIGAGTGVEVDSVELVHYPGFQVPADTNLLPFTRDHGSLMAQYPRLVETALNNELGAFGTQGGNMNTFIRRVPGNKVAHLDMRVTPLDANMGRLRIFATEQPQNAYARAYPYVFVKSTLEYINTAGGWNAVTSPGLGMLDLLGNVILKNSGATGMAVTHSKLIYFGPNSYPLVQPGTYLALLRVYTTSASNQQYSVSVLTDGAGTGPGVVTVQNMPTSQWVMIPCGDIQIPLGGVRPGGRYAVTLAGNANYQAGSLYIDGIYLQQSDDENPGIQLLMSQSLDYTIQQVELYHGERPDSFRTAYSGLKDQAPGWDAINTAPGLYPGVDNRLWFQYDRWNGASYPTNTPLDRIYVDMWCRPCDRIIR